MHSSLDEIQNFLKLLKPAHIVPIVTNTNYLNVVSIQRLLSAYLPDTSSETHSAIMNVDQRQSHEGHLHKWETKKADVLYSEVQGQAEGGSFRPSDTSLLGLPALAQGGDESYYMIKSQQGSGHARCMAQNIESTGQLSVTSSSTHSLPNRDATFQKRATSFQEWLYLKRLAIEKTKHSIPPPLIVCQDDPISQVDAKLVDDIHQQWSHGKPTFLRCANPFHSTN
jgi:hypothetical protein